jgi:hypothetical protein
MAEQLHAFFGEEKWRVIFLLDTWSPWVYLTTRLIN